ncbi:MAG: GNAT family N-acetyltransferase [Calditrichaeota bacterium]|nr:GNAT family N-acetyltransferase [Candidatus Cloacimonadota bacterium]MCB1047711.1 GNAT family N-acetyltransferase [Calditrichota bacterium]MCB9472487.1 GNAT family N-acetyltransferase [Candidatus Delongbacteria bacterium]
MRVLLSEETEMVGDTSQYISPESGFYSCNAPEVATALSDLSHDVYHLPEYLQLCADQENAEPLYYIGNQGRTRVLIPLLRRPIPGELSPDEPLWDLASPYGYPCPLVSLPDSQDSLVSLFEGFRKTAAEAGIVSAFLRLHPLYSIPLDQLRSVGELFTHGQTVYMDLQLSEEDGWRETRQRHRGQIRQLLREGFHCELDCWEYYPEFQQIYLDTMARVGATSYYHFDIEYFDGLREALGERLHLACVLSPQNKLAAAALFMRQSGLLQYHLSGTRDEFLQLGPSKLMFHELRHWGCDKGLRFLHLGGGLGGSNTDPLFRFKSGFSSLKADFHSFRMVIDHERFEFLTRRRAELEGPGFEENLGSFFPAYRKQLR